MEKKMNTKSNYPVLLRFSGIVLFIGCLPMSYYAYYIKNSMDAVYMFYAYLAFTITVFFLNYRLRCPKCHEQFSKKDGFLRFNFKCNKCGHKLLKS